MCLAPCCRDAPPAPALFAFPLFTSAAFVAVAPPHLPWPFGFRLLIVLCVSASACLGNIAFPLHPQSRGERKESTDMFSPADNGLPPPRDSLAFASIPALHIIPDDELLEHGPYPTSGPLRQLEIERKPDEKLGITVTGGADTRLRGTFVKAVSSSGAAAAISLKPGDRILAVDGLGLLTTRYEASLAALKNCGQRVRLIVQSLEPDSWRLVMSQVKAEARREGSMSLAEGDPRNPRPINMPLIAQPPQALHTEGDFLLLSLSQEAACRVVGGADSVIGAFVVASEEPRLGHASPLRRGDRLLEIGGQCVLYHTMAELRDLLDSLPSQRVDVAVQRLGHSQWEQLQQLTDFEMTVDGADNVVLPASAPRQASVVATPYLIPVASDRSAREVRIPRQQGKLGLSVLAPSEPGRSEEEQDGAYIAEIKSNLAMAAGARVGDRVLAVDGVDVADASGEQIRQLLENGADPCALLLELQEVAFDRLVTEREASHQDRLVTLHDLGRYGLGLDFVVNEEAAQEIFILHIDPNGAAGMDGRLRRGDQVVALDGRDLRLANRGRPACTCCRSRLFARHRPITTKPHHGMHVQMWQQRPWKTLETLFNWLSGSMTRLGHLARTAPWVARTPRSVDSCLEGLWPSFRLPGLVLAVLAEAWPGIFSLSHPIPPPRGFLFSPSPRVASWFGARSLLRVGVGVQIQLLRCKLDLIVLPATRTSLGFSVAGGSDTSLRLVFAESVDPGSVAEEAGLAPGVILAAVGDRGLLHVSHRHALQLIQDAARPTNAIIMHTSPTQWKLLQEVGDGSAHLAFRELEIPLAIPHSKLTSSGQLLAKSIAASESQRVGFSLVGGAETAFGALFVKEVQAGSICSTVLRVGDRLLEVSTASAPPPPLWPPPLSCAKD